jgi:ubiquinone/menaquinone biosynthesis C-methylase UbiE
MASSDEDEEAILRHYAAGIEQDRLSTGASRIELARTQEILERVLPEPPARVLDVGGGPGAYATWLAGRGYRVHLIDLVPLHAEQAAAAAQDLGGTLTVEVGDARRLPVADGSIDAVLLLGPLYHLTERAERIQALEEARRVGRPGAPVVAAAISRFASTLDGLVQGFLGDAEFDAIVEQDLATGQHRNPTDRPGWFTTAYFHRAEELAAEARDAGLVVEQVLGVEGPGWLLPDAWDDPDRRAQVLRAARTLEGEPTLLGLSAHLLVVARTP